MKVIKTTDGKQIKRISRWIKVRQAYNVTEKHSLYYYVEEVGENENALDYFIFKGKKYALGQFLRFGTPWSVTSINWYEDDKLHFMGGYDSENYYKPLLIELDECCEYVRLYEEL